MRNIFLTLLILFSASVFAQVPNHLISPVDIPVTLSASFGELRPNHFHSGIDIKTQQQIGLPMYSIDDGYVWRISISKGGYGNCLYLKHKDVISVYAHLDRFSPEITEWIRDYQYKNKTFEIDAYPEQNEIPVKQGQQVAWGGNSGSSGGPHLHFEIRDTTGEYVYDAQPLYNVYDNVYPRYKNIAINPVSGEGVVDNSYTYKIYGVKRTGTGQYVANTVKAWGKIGLEVKAFDYMTGQNNFYGLKSLKLYVEDKLTFSFVMDKFSLEDTRYINSFINYGQWQKTRDTFMRCYLLPNNPLPFYTSYNRGYLEINEEKDYKVRVLISDVVGNTSELNFTIKGVKKDIPPLLTDSGTYVDYRLPALIQGEGYGMFIPRGSLYDNVYFDHKVKYDSVLKANIYQMHYQTEPLQNYASLFIKLPKDSVPASKHYVARKGRRGEWNYVNTTVYNDSILRVKTNSLGDFTVKVDTIAPEIRPQSRTSSRIMLKLVDKQSGINRYEGYINGEWVLFEEDFYGRVSYKLDKKRLKTKRPYHLEFRAYDNCGNMSEYKLRW
jgi:murein DD-endopeptidase MepM/ murein hydrolase activator NlpD